MTRSELEARENILEEQYSGIINIEAKTMVYMASNLIEPAVIKYVTELARSISTIQKACPGADTSVQEDALVKISALLAETKAASDAIDVAVAYASSKEDSKSIARAYRDQVFSQMAVLRNAVDTLEGLVAKEAWPMPTYGDLLFLD